MDEAVLEQARGARTQSLYRDVNERVNEINTAFGELIPLSEWICECDDATCSERMELTHGEYEIVRTDPRRFAVLPEHFNQRIEHLAEQNDGYWVVEKFGVAGDLAAKVDPRRVGLRGRNGDSAVRAEEATPFVARDGERT